MPDGRFETDGMTGCGAARPSWLAQQPSQWHREEGEEATALDGKDCCRHRAVVGPMRLHGGRGQQPAPESQEEHHEHRCLALIRPPAPRGLADLVFLRVSKSRALPETLRKGPWARVLREGDTGGIDLPVWLRGVWSKLPDKSTTYSVTLVKQIIGGGSPPASAEVRFLTVGEESAGQRLDNFLLRVLKGVPKTHVYRIIRSGEVRVNKGRASADARVAEGDVVRLPPVRLSERAAAKAEQPAPAREFPLLYEDEHLLAIDKPAGVAVHGGSGVSFGVIEQLRQARPAAKFLELVHRLDRETSGILLVAKKRSALTRLQDQFRERETGKTYLAAVTGTWPANRKVIDQPLHKYLQADGERRVRVVAKDDPDGMRSITLVKVGERIALPLPLAGEGRGEGATLLEVTIKTGRTHQIRVHLASAGHPILGDDKYGDFELNKLLGKHGLKRMFLHAWRLQFDHPATGERIALQAPLPPELHKFLDHARVPPPPLRPDRL
jgi:23S rRNA pseudouridine955/2504/2580 synthase